MWLIAGVLTVIGLLIVLHIIGPEMRAADRSEP